MKIGRIVVVGASGMVGRTLLDVMSNHQIMPDSMALVGLNTVGKKLRTHYGEITVWPPDIDVFSGSQLVFLAAGASVSKELKNLILRADPICRVIDLSSAFRYDPEIPLVIPSINGSDIGDSRFIACPNCTTSIALMALAPIHRQYKITRVDMASYQAASGAGKKALEDLEAQIAEWANKGQPPASGKTASAPYPLAGNLLARIDTAEPDWNGFTREEMKTAWESEKILFKEQVPFYSTCIRVPVRRCHSEALTIRVSEKPKLQPLRQLLTDSFGLTVLDNLSQDSYPMPLNMEEQENIGVGRIRITPEGDIMLWLCGDQLLRGAALTAVEIAEHIFS